MQKLAMANPHTSVKARKHGVPNKMSSARVERALREGKRLPPENLLLVGCGTALLGLDGMFGLKGWQIMYIAEAIPTVVIGIATFFILTDKPSRQNS